MDGNLDRAYGTAPNYSAMPVHVVSQLVREEIPGLGKVALPFGYEGQKLDNAQELEKVLLPTKPPLRK